MARILVVDDEAQLRRSLRINLAARDYEVLEADDGRSALRLAADRKPDLVLLDLGLPDLDGIDVITALRGWYKAPIVVLTVRDDEAAKVAALDAGADDYITKPFESSVLIARISAVLRRRMPPVKADSQTFSLGELKVNFSTFDVYCGESRVHLTKSEFKLLQSLIEERGRVLTRTQLIDLVQGAGISVVDRAIDTHIFGLRKKLGDCSEWIETIRGVGYRVRPD